MGVALAARTPISVSKSLLHVGSTRDWRRNVIPGLVAASWTCPGQKNHSLGEQWVVGQAAAGGERGLAWKFRRIHQSESLCWTPLEAQGLRIQLAVQGTWVQSLVQEDSTSHEATKPMCYPYTLELSSATRGITALYSWRESAHITKDPALKKNAWVGSNEVDETGAHYIERSKSERKAPIPHTNAYIWGLERW